MEDKIKLLVAIGTAVGANCQPCLENLSVLAMAGGVEMKEIQEAIGVAKAVRRGAIEKTDEVAASLFGGGKPVKEGSGTGCICDFGLVDGTMGKK